VDPLTGNFLVPVTNYYTMVYYNPTNYQVYDQTFQRIVTRPDILFSAQDLAVGPAGNNFNGTVVRNINFEEGNVLPGLAGPGVIDGSTSFVYNKVGGIYENGPFPDTNSCVDGIGVISTVNQTTSARVLQWASFDGSTNDPVLYPNGTSIQQLENQMIIGISPAILPNGSNNQVYSATLTVSGGQPSYAWSVVTGSLPNGLGLSPSYDGSSCTIFGTPYGNPSGTYDFTIQLRDSAARTVQRAYSITIQ
jgi:Putative Ig domain